MITAHAQTITVIVSWIQSRFKLQIVNSSNSFTNKHQNHSFSSFFAYLFWLHIYCTMGLKSPVMATLLLFLVFAVTWFGYINHYFKPLLTQHVLQSPASPSLMSTHNNLTSNCNTIEIYIITGLGYCFVYAVLCFWCLPATLKLTACSINLLDISFQ